MYGRDAEFDLQLAAAYDFRIDLGESARHARLAIAAAQRLDTTEVRAKALLFLAEAHAMRQELADMEECLRQASALMPADRFSTALATRLYLSHRTVEKHVENLLRKTGATSRTMLVAVTGPWPHVPASPVT